MSANRHGSGVPLARVAGSTRSPREDRARTGSPRLRTAAVAAALALAVLTGCDQSSPLDEVSSPDGEESVEQAETPVEAPETGLCRVLDAD